MPADRLRHQLADLEFPLDAAKRADIQHGVDEYVDSLKALEWPPERVIVAVKRIANEVGLKSSGRVTLPGALSERDRLMVDLVGWSIQRYYGTTRES